MVRKRLLVLAAGAATVTLIGVTVAALLGGAVAAPGSAIEDGMADIRRTLPVVIGSRFYLEVPALENTSNTPLTIRSAHPINDPAGVRIVDLRVYNRADFDGSELGAWSSSGSGGEGGAMQEYDPAKKPSKPVIGVTIPPKKSAATRPEEFILMELNATRLGVWRWPGTEIEYEQNGLKFKQGIGPQYVTKVAKDKAELQQLYGQVVD